MRHLTKVELKTIRIEEEMLRGNINRMCVCDDTDELTYNCLVAIKRLIKIMSINEKRFKDVNK